MRRGIDGLQDLDRPPVMKPLPTVPISFEEFLDWCDEDTRAEWVNGEVVLLSPDSIPHDDLIEFLSRVLGIYAEHRRLGKVFTRTILMKTDAIPSGRMPDLFFVKREQEKRLKHY
jgi:Uma2 family endonuclease